MNECKYSKRCWRYAYSRFYLEKEKYTVPPTREILYFQGYCSNEMIGNKRHGVYCECMPLQGKEINLCPILINGLPSYCFEFKKEEKKQLRENQKSFPNKAKRLSLPRLTREQVCKRYKYTCVYCGKACNSFYTDRYGNKKKVKIVIDHHIPLSYGINPLDESNLVVACFQCNSEKGTDIWELNCKKGIN